MFDRTITRIISAVHCDSAVVLPPPLDLYSQSDKFKPDNNFAFMHS